LESRPAALQERIFQRLFQVADEESLTHKEQEDYNESLKRYWDAQSIINTAVQEAEEKIVKVKDEIIHQKEELILKQEELIKEKESLIEKQAKEKETIVKNLIEKGLSLEVIAEITGIDTNRITEIEKQES
jgi:hypothetical protein